LPFPGGFERLSDRLLRDIELVDIEIPDGTLTVDRTQFTPIQEAHYQANQFMQRGDWPRAVEALQRVFELGPQPPLLPAFYTMLGIAQFRARDLDVAIHSFREAIKLDENTEFAHLFLGTALMLTYRFEEAIGPLMRVLELAPRETHVNFYLGHVYSKLGRYDEAIAAYNAELEIHGGSPEVYQDLARLYVQLGDRNRAAGEQYYLKAIEIYRKLAGLHPDDPATSNFIGYLYSRLGQLQPAIEAYQQAVQAAPDDVIALSNLGTAYLVTEHNRDAKEIFERLARYGEGAMRRQLARVSSDPDEAVRLSMAEAYQKLGAALLKMYQAEPAAGDRDLSLLVEAEVAFKAALDYLPSDVHSLYNLGVTYYMSGRRAAAVRQFRRVLEIEPDNKDASNNLRVAEEELGKVRHWLGSRVYRRLEKSSEETPIYSEDLLTEIAEGLVRIREGVEAAPEDELFTSDDLFRSLLPLMEYIPSAEARADLAARIVMRGWLTPDQAAQLVGADIVSFLGYLHMKGVSLSELAGGGAGDSQDYTEASVEALTKVLELRPDDERAGEQLQVLMGRRLDERLRELGLLTEVKKPITDFTPYQNRALIKVQGRPVSETILEDRR
jgi:tetratricopeptide (TPR) repeat protein